MNNITVLKNEDNVDYVIIDNGNGNYTSMLKSTYDSQQSLITNEPPTGGSN